MTTRDHPGSGACYHTCAQLDKEQIMLGVAAFPWALRTAFGVKQAAVLLSVWWIIFGHTLGAEEIG